MPIGPTHKCHNLERNKKPLLELLKNASYHSRETVGLKTNYNKDWIMVNWKEDAIYRYGDQATK